MSNTTLPGDCWTRERALDELRAGHVKEWNDYRRDHPGWTPVISTAETPADLCGVVLVTRGDDGRLAGINLEGVVLRDADLTTADLRMARLMGAKLTGVVLNGANLQNASLPLVHLDHANLNGADLRGARLPNAHLQEANLIGANLEDANLEDADCSGVNLQHSNLTAAALCGVNLSSANLSGVVYDRRKMVGRYHNIRIATGYGNAIFKRDATDQDFLDALHQWVLKQRGLTRVLSGSGVFLWGLLTDYGRSFLRLSLFALLAALIFGVAYDLLNCIHLQVDGRETNPFMPYYYSIVTYTRGFGTAVPSTMIGDVLVVMEVIFGYITLGLMLSIMGNRIARRA